MYKHQIKEILIDLKKTNKAIISLGCSFVQGQGAVNDELYTDYEWKYEEIGRPLEIQIDDNQKKDILEKYKNIKLDHQTLDTSELNFIQMEYDNAFVNVLCKKYFNGSYTPINFGFRGCGNRASIKELYFNPQIEFNRLQEIIVIYCPSGLERFDFINDGFTDDFYTRWKCMWPSSEETGDLGRRKLWQGYGEYLWSDKFQILEQIAHVQELVCWCKLHNAKLIITPGFDRRYNKKYFDEHLSGVVERDEMTGKIKNIKKFFNVLDYFKKKSSEHLNLFPWKNMFKPEGHLTFLDLVMSKDQINDKTDIFFQFLGKGSPDKWITSCAHPSAKAHDLFAKTLFEYITDGNARICL